MIIHPKKLIELFTLSHVASFILVMQILTYIRFKCYALIWVSDRFISLSPLLLFISYLKTLIVELVMAHGKIILQGIAKLFLPKIPYVISVLC